MSANDLADWYVHTASVEMHLGTAGSGADLFAAAVILPGFADTARHLVRAKDGEQLVSESTFVTYPINAPVFVPESRVTVNGVTSIVITANLGDSGVLDLPDHVAVSLK